jgi:hypothetical protein
MIEVATIKFMDLETSSGALAIVRCTATEVAMCFSLETNGDIEVTMSKADARRVLLALHKAVEGRDL